MENPYNEKRYSTELTLVEMTEQEKYEWQRLKKLCAEIDTDLWELLHLAENAAFTARWERFYEEVDRQQRLECKARGAAKVKL